MRHSIGVIPSTRRLIAFTVAALFCSLVFGSTLAMAARDSRPMVGSQTGADFVVGGFHPDLAWPKNLEDQAKHDQLVFWGSWLRRPVDGNVLLGPFKPPAHFSLLVSGMPFDHGNLLLLIRLPDHAVYVVTRDTPGNKWEQVDIDLPPDWVGHNIQLQGVGYRHTDDSWLAFSEPFNIAKDGMAVPLWANRTLPWRWHYWGAMYLLPIGIIFLLFSVVGLSGYAALRHYLQTPAYLAPIIIAAVVAFWGFVTFWAFFIRTPVGMGVAWIIIAGSTLHLIYRLYKQGLGFIPRSDISECKWPVMILIVGVLFYLGLMNLPRVDSTSMEVLASRRPVTWTLPSDNVLQQDIGWFLYHHRDPRSVDTPLWQSSDRPPLECGVQLLSAPLMHGVLNVPWNMNGQFAGMVLQMIWIYAAWATARALGFSTRASGQIVLCLIGTPFLYINSIYVWSKLSAATFAIGATLLLCFRGTRPLVKREIVLAGALIALGMLAHSGIIFYLFPMVAFWVFFPGLLVRPAWGQVVMLGVVAVILFLPWTLYQKVYDPPGDHLLKLHIAGAMDDPVTPAFDNNRKLSSAVKDAYHNASWATLWSNRVANFNSLIKGDWTTLFRPLSANIPQSREDFFLYTFRTCGVYLLGFPAIFVLLVLRKGNRLRPYFFLLCVIVCSFVIWCLIMFGPDSTIIHQGAYANQLLLMLSLVCLLRLVHPLLLAVVCGYNLVQFLWVYADCLPYHAVTDKLSIAILIGATVVGVILWMVGGNTDPAEQHDGKNRDIGRENLRGFGTAIPAASA